MPYRTPPRLDLPPNLDRTPSVHSPWVLAYAHTRTHESMGASVYTHAYITLSISSLQFPALVILSGGYVVGEWMGGFQTQFPRSQMHDTIMTSFFFFHILFCAADMAMTTH